MFQNFISLGLFEVLITWANTIILFLVLKKLLFKPVKTFMENRQNEVAKAFNEADEAKAKAELLEKQYADKIAMAKSEAAEIVKEASKRGEDRFEEIVAEAKKEAERITVKANSEIEREKQKAMNEIKDDISEIAMMIASKVIQKDINSSDHDRLIKDFIDNVGDTSWQN